LSTSQSQTANSPIEKPEPIRSGPQLTLPAGGLELTWKEEQLWVLPDKGLYSPNRKSLVVSDLHLGKAMHFRKAGIGVPAQAEIENLKRLDRMIVQSGAQTLVVCGDMFHSDMNAAVDLFEAWRACRPTMEIVLVRGNHDIMPRTTYTRLGIEVAEGGYGWGSFCLYHDPEAALRAFHKAKQPVPYAFAGHLHPGLYVGGQAVSGLTLPALVLGAHVGVLPCFGTFTGLACQTLEAGDKGFVFSSQRVFAVN
jgi:uncharacterized protein